MEQKSPMREKILATIINKSTLKQRIFDNTFSTFNELKDVLFEIASELDDDLDGRLDKRVRIEYRDRGKFEAQLQIASDLLIFQMHTDIFEFDSNHIIWQNNYVQSDRDNSYCGVINIYNFLSDWLPDWSHLHQPREGILCGGQASNIGAPYDIWQRQDLPRVTHLDYGVSYQLRHQLRPVDATLRGE